jgi:serine/threonine protein kinase
MGGQRSSSCSCVVAEMVSEVMRMMTKTGTVAFSAPEIFTQKVYDEKVDIWSAGIVLYMMLAGKTPYEDEDNVNKLV